MNRFWILFFGLSLEILLGFIFYFFYIRALEINNLNLEQAIKAEKILENNQLKNIENLKIKNSADQKFKLVFNGLMEQLPASDRLDNLILNLSDQANIFRLGNLEIKWIGLNPGQNLENLGLADLSMAMTGSYLNFLNFYEQGILKKYPMVKINRLSLSKDKMQLDMGFIVLPQISD